VKYALDADVLIGALDGSDSHHAKAHTLFKTWHAHGDSRLISVINLSEVLVAPAADNHKLRLARAAIAALEVTVHQPTEAIAVDAARLRGRHPISLPDAYLLATARHTGSAIASFDRKVKRAAQAEQIAVAAT
jgi:predicted nucleic acid-binding protein